MFLSFLWYELKLFDGKQKKTWKKTLPNKYDALKRNRYFFYCRLLLLLPLPLLPYIRLSLWLLSLFTGLLLFRFMRWCRLCVTASICMYKTTTALFQGCLMSRYEQMENERWEKKQNQIHSKSFISANSQLKQVPLFLPKKTKYQCGLCRLVHRCARCSSFLRFFLFNTFMWCNYSNLMRSIRLKKIIETHQKPIFSMNL